MTASFVALFGHAALTTLFRGMINYSPANKFIHAVMQVDGRPRTNGDVNKRQYGYRKLFH